MPLIDIARTKTKDQAPPAHRLIGCVVTSRNTTSSIPTSD
jgi:hypothetical protein